MLKETYPKLVPTSATKWHSAEFGYGAGERLVVTLEFSAPVSLLRPGAPLAVAGVHGGVTAHDAPQCHDLLLRLQDEKLQAALAPYWRLPFATTLFATQAERPFLCPPKLTFVFRACSTIDGIGKTLDRKYDFSVLSAPYLRELADLRAKRRGLSWSGGGGA